MRGDANGLIVFGLQQVAWEPVLRNAS
jgi:hypothetical protein